MRYTLDGTNVVRTPSNNRTLWPLSTLSGEAFLLSEHQSSFAWYASRHSFAMQFGLHHGNAQTLIRKAAKPQANPDANAENKDTLDGYSVVLRQALMLIDRDAFLRGAADSIKGKDLRGGVRISPDRHNLTGWAWDKNNSVDPVTIICFHNDRCVYMSLADKDNVRWEGGEKVISPRRNGFHLPLSALDLHDGDQIDIYFLKAKLRLSGCPVVVRNGLLHSQSTLATGAGTKGGAAGLGPLFAGLVGKVRRAVSGGRRS